MYIIKVFDFSLKYLPCCFHETNLMWTLKCSLEMFLWHSLLVHLPCHVHGSTIKKVCPVFYWLILVLYARISVFYFLPWESSLLWLSSYIVCVCLNGERWKCCFIWSYANSLQFVSKTESQGLSFFPPKSSSSTILTFL